MTKEEYDKAKKEICKQYGFPTYEMNAPTNECAKKLMELKVQYKKEKDLSKALEQKEKGFSQAPENFEQLAKEEINKDGMRKFYKQIPLSEIVLSDSDLKPFTPKEQEILKDLYNDLDVQPGKLAAKHGVSRQKLAGFMESTQFRLLQTKIWAKLKKFETIKAYLKLLKAGDSRAILRAAEDEKLVSNEKLDVNMASKPIEDPKAMDLLRQLGNKLSE